MQSTSTEARKPTGDNDFRCGYCAILGEPNVGKSTFLNAALGTRLSIVTPKPQTTRRRILGFRNAPDHQIVFVDTPGLIEPRYALQRAMMESARRALRDADVVFVLDDAEASIRRAEPLPEGIVDLLESVQAPAIIALNKTDLVRDKTTLLPRIAELDRIGRFRAVIPLSALREDGVDTAIREIVALLPVHPALYDRDELTDLPQRFFVSEIVREKILLTMREEIPYAVEVVVASYEEKEALDVIAADIVVGRESQRGILVGAGGEAIKRIGTLARADIERLAGKRVWLDLHVKVRNGWRDDETWVRRFGYEFPD